MGTSVLHIKTEVECRVYLFDEEKGIAKPGTYFNIEVRKGEQDLLFVSTEDEAIRYQLSYIIKEIDTDYRVLIEKIKFKQLSSEVLEWIHTAEQGDDVAQTNLGLYYEDQKREIWNDDPMHDHLEAMKWFRRAAVNGNATAQCELGCCYLFGIWGDEEDEHDYEEALKWFQMAEGRDDNDARFFLGYCYYHGKGVEQDFVEAASLFRYSAEFGNKKAQLILAKCYELGEGVEQDIIEAIKWYRIYGEGSGYHSSNRSIFDSGWCSNEGLEQFRKTAVNKISNAASHGDFDALNNLGDCYYIGYGVNPDWGMAEHCYRKASFHNTHALFNLGWCYYYGIGVEENKKKAVSLFEQSALRGDYDAEYALGRCYRDGIGVEQNMSKANEWFNNLSSAQDEDARYCYLRYSDNDVV